MKEMKSIQVEKLLDLSKTIAFQLFSGHLFPWEVLPDINSYLMELGNNLDQNQFDHPQENVWIAKSANVFSSAYITGPCIIDEDAEIRHCAFIRGSVLIGKYAVVGNSTEIKNSILFDGVQVPHYNYVGDSVLGFKSHMGAGAVTSNVKSDKSPVTIRFEGKTIETTLRKFGAILGDFAEIGCGTVLNPGSLVGRNTNIYPLSMVRGVVSEGSIYKNKNEIVDKSCVIQDLHS